VAPGSAADRLGELGRGLDLVAEPRGELVCVCARLQGAGRERGIRGARVRVRPGGRGQKCARGGRGARGGGGGSGRVQGRADSGFPGNFLVIYTMKWPYINIVFDLEQ